MLTLNPDAELQAAIAKNRRKGESLEALLARLLSRDALRQDAVRKQHLRSLRQKIDFLESGIRRDQSTITRHRREIAELLGIQPDD